MQDAALRAFRGIKGFGAINARAWSLTIVRNTRLSSWLMKNRPKAVVFTNDLSVTEQQELEHEGPQGALHRGHPKRLRFSRRMPRSFSMHWRNCRRSFVKSLS